MDFTAQKELVTRKWTSDWAETIYVLLRSFSHASHRSWSWFFAPHCLKYQSWVCHYPAECIGPEFQLGCWSLSPVASSFWVGILFLCHCLTWKLWSYFRLKITVYSNRGGSCSSLLHSTASLCLWMGGVQGSEVISKFQHPWTLHMHTGTECGGVKCKV